MALKIAIDLSLCKGHAMCVGVAPEIFDLNEDAGVAVLIHDAPDDGFLGKAEEAVLMCPTSAISVAED